MWEPVYMIRLSDVMLLVDSRDVHKGIPIDTQGLSAGVCLIAIGYGCFIYKYRPS